LPTRLVELLEPVEAVTAVPHDPARSAHVTQLLRQLQQPHLRLDDLLLRRHRPRVLSPLTGLDTESTLSPLSAGILTFPNDHTCDRQTTAGDAGPCIVRRETKAVVAPSGALPLAPR